MKYTLLAVATFALTACHSTSTSVPIKVTNPDGTTTVKSAKTFQTQGDIIGGGLTLTTTPQGAVTLDIKPLDKDQVVFAKVALRDGKGNPLFDKEGKPVYDEIPYAAGIYHSRASATFWDGMSKLFRSIGSVIGTIGASLTGVEAANQLGPVVDSVIP